MDDSAAENFEMKQALKRELERLVRDFDHREGAFAGLDYLSPRSMITPTLAERSGHPLEAIRDALTDWRVFKNCQLSLSEESRKIIDDVAQAVESWRAETGYRDPPTNLKKKKWRNIKEMRVHIENAFVDMGLGDVDSDRDDGALVVYGRLSDKFGHKFFLSLEVKTRYRGEIEVSLPFPYYDYPYALNSFDFMGLLGWRDCSLLELPMPERFLMYADEGKLEFPNIDKRLKILRAVLSYIKQK